MSPFAEAWQRMVGSAVPLFDSTERWARISPELYPYVEQQSRAAGARAYERHKRVRAEGG
jgi:hypothetical protein